MRLIAKKGTAFEQTIKAMCEKRNFAFSYGLDIVEKFVGVRPKNVYFTFHWGTICKLLPEFLFDSDDVSRIKPKYLRKKKGTMSIFVPALRYKEGKDLDSVFRSFANDYELTDEPLHEYGIYMVDMKRGASYNIQPAHDAEKDCYMIICSSPNAFDEKNLAKDQFEIEIF